MEGTLTDKHLAGACCCLSFKESDKKIILFSSKYLPSNKNLVYHLWIWSYPLSMILLDSKVWNPNHWEFPGRNRQLAASLGGDFEFKLVTSYWWLRQLDILPDTCQYNVDKDTFFVLSFLDGWEHWNHQQENSSKQWKTCKCPVTEKARIPQKIDFYDCFYNLKGAACYIWWNTVNQDLRQFLMDRKEKPIVARLRNNLVNHTDLSLKQRTAPIYAEL